MTRAILLVDDDENDVVIMTMAMKKAGLSCPSIIRWLKAGSTVCNVMIRTGVIL